MKKRERGRRKGSGRKRGWVRERKTGVGRGRQEGGEAEKESREGRVGERIGGKE